MVASARAYVSALNKFIGCAKCATFALSVIHNPSQDETSCRWLCSRVALPCNRYIQSQQHAAQDPAVPVTASQDSDAEPLSRADAQVAVGI